MPRLVPVCLVFGSDDELLASKRGTQGTSARASVYVECVFLGGSAKIGQRGVVCGRRELGSENRGPGQQRRYERCDFQARGLT